MAFSIEDIGDIDHIVGQWCLEKIPPELKNQINHDYEIDGQAVTIFEVRPVWRQPQSSREVAQSPTEPKGKPSNDRANVHKRPLTYPARLAILASPLKIACTEAT